MTHVGAPKRILAFLETGEKVVARSINRCASVIGGSFNFHRQFRHCLGALSVSMIHARAAQHPGHLGVLS
jgi:hypothetical protein